MMNIFVAMVGWTVTVVGTAFLLLWALLAVLDRGVKMAGLVYVILAWTKANRPFAHRLITRGIFARGPVPPQSPPVQPPPKT